MSLSWAIRGLSKRMSDRSSTRWRAKQSRHTSERETACIAPRCPKAVRGIEDLTEEIFGPVLHVATFRANEIDAVMAAVNSAGFGLTFGLHTRLSKRMRKVAASVAVGNLYVNCRQIGAVVGSQPFGGEGLSGTGPKAGGPRYLPRFTTGELALLKQSLDLPGATGDLNILRAEPRTHVLCAGPSESDREMQHAMVASAGGIAVDGDAMYGGPVDAAISFAEEAELALLRRMLADRQGAIVPLLTSPRDIGLLQVERHLCVDTTAAGGNAALMSRTG
jgi:RHH-type proline utilization regulon transcriptional repressor/proline dehydrogenase/delta 1-pyrroline-5-carboxylate dehydrogenase